MFKNETFRFSMIIPKKYLIIINFESKYIYKWYEYLKSPLICLHPRFLILGLLVLNIFIPIDELYFL